MRNLLLSTVCFFLVPAISVAAPAFITTHTTPIELKPISNFSKSYQTAAVCFLGYGDCAPYNGGDDYSRPGNEICLEGGYSVTSCNLPEYLYGQCPDDGRYYMQCKEDTGRACTDAGYTLSCGDGYITDASQVCPYNTSYFKCKCNPCDGYGYTYAEATSEGYEVSGSCNSCGTMKYQRQNAACSGYLSCDCGGAIGADTCKSGTNTLYNSCEECVKCDDTCPSGYYKTAGANGSCNFGSSTSKTECGTTCYKCKHPNPNYDCWSDCPEGAIYNQETHDYTCEPLTCRDKIMAKYPNYFNGNNDSCDSYPNNNYKFDCPFFGEGKKIWYSNRNVCPLKQKVITQSFYTEDDFSKEFRECSFYCRPRYVLDGQILRGNLYMGFEPPSVSFENEEMKYNRNVTIDGNVTFSSISTYFDSVTITENSVVLTGGGIAKRVVMYPNSQLYTSQVHRATIMENTESTPVTMHVNYIKEEDITSNCVLTGKSCGLYLNVYQFFGGGDYDNYSIDRNPGGKINLFASIKRNHGVYLFVLFKNPGIDTTVYIDRKSENTDRYCFSLANDEYKKICVKEGKDIKITFLTDDYSRHVLPACCSMDSGCTNWNSGTVKCEGYSE